MSDPIRSISQNNYLLSNGGGGHEYSGANGVYVDNDNEVIGLDTSASNAIETVIENSGAWGGAGLPISAGPGIKVGLENGVLMISNDETVLWSGNVSGGQTADLSESYSAFKEIKFKYRNWRENDYGSIHTERFDTDNTKFDTICGWYQNAAATRAIFIGSYSATDPTHIKLITAAFTNGGSTWNGTGDGYRLLEIVGIGRKSN